MDKRERVISVILCRINGETLFGKLAPWHAKTSTLKITAEYAQENTRSTKILTLTL
jgi:hypothetical protein